MNKSKNIILFLSIIILCGAGFFAYKMYFNQDLSKESTDSKYISNNNTTIKSSGFFDGLPEPDSVIDYPLDEFGMGVAQKSTYYIDINKDNVPDKITKTFVETGNAHSYYEYKVELKQGNKYIDITPVDLKTINGDDCDLQQIRFSLNPKFSAKIIYRELGDFWNQPTVANKKIFTLSDNKMRLSETKTLKPVCDVKKLF